MATRMAKEAEATRTGNSIRNADSKTKSEWRDTTEAEIKAFIALVIVIGNNKRLKSYWSLDCIITMEGLHSVSVMCYDPFT